MRSRRCCARKDPPDLGRTLAVAAAGTLLVLVAFTTPLTTLASTAAGLDAGLGAQAWVLSSMNVGTAAGLLSSGAIGDDYGRRRTFLAGTLLLAGSSVLACGLSLIGHAFPEGPARATGVWGAALGAGVAIGPILAAGLEAVGGWRLPYAVTALAAAAQAVAGRTLLPESRAARPRPVDAAGTLLLGLGLAPTPRSGDHQRLVPPRPPLDQPRHQGREPPPNRPPLEPPGHSPTRRASSSTRYKRLRKRIAHERE